MLKKTENEFDYELVIEPVDDDANGLSSWTFPINKSLNLIKEPIENTASIGWQFDEKQYIFEFSSNSKDAEMALICLTRCIYENDHQKASENVDQEQLLVYVRELNVDVDVEVDLPSLPLSANDLKDLTERCEKIATFQVFDDEKEFYIPIQSDIKAKLLAGSGKSFDRALSVESDDGTLLWAQRLTESMHHHFASAQKTFVWMYVPDDATDIVTLSLQFESSEDALSFNNTFSECLWETKQHSNIDKLAEDDRAWIRDGDTDTFADMAWDRDDGLSDDDRADFQSDDDASEDDDNDNNVSDNSKWQPDADGASNSLLSVGRAHNRAFVVRGSRVGVFKQTNDDDLEYMATFSPLKNAEGKALKPHRSMLHSADTSLLLSDPTAPKSLFRLDLERGDVVEEWQTSSNVREMLPETKHAPETDSKVLLGLNSKEFFAMDARQRGDKCVSSRHFQYTRNPGISCGATTGKGQIVLATDNGDIRLFSEKRSRLSATDLTQRKPRSSTTLPGFGDPVTAVDVSDDGLWVLATCKRYLLAIPTKLDDSNGFEKRMGGRKPAPRRLQLKIEDVRKLGGVVNFTPARFNVGAAGERSIVTSTGAWVITWNFRKVKQNVLDVYQMKRYDDIVVQDQFARNTDKKVVVALPNDVLLATKSKVATNSPDKRKKK